MTEVMRTSRDPSWGSTDRKCSMREEEALLESDVFPICEVVIVN